MNLRSLERLTRRVVGIGAIVALGLTFAPALGRADATTAISEPRGNPYHVPLDAQGRPIPFTVAVAGFPAGSLVYVEQCDAQPPSATNWAPTRNCDIGSSPAAAIVDGKGQARFDAGDRNHAFQPFVGLGPESLFKCLTAGAAPAKNGLSEFRSCQIRVSSNNSQSTADQVFLPIVFGSASASSGAQSSSSSSSRSMVILVVVILVVLIGAGLALGLRARRTPRSA
jgi:hypothetical protein